MIYLFFAGLLMLSGCGKFNHTPYGADAYNTEYNSQAIKFVSTLSTGSPHYKVALISDTHSYYDELQALIKALNKENYAFIIHAGDITNFGLNSEFATSLKYFKKLKHPMMTVPGNHDLLSHGEILYRKIFGSSNYYFEFSGTLFVFANNNNWESGEGNDAIPFIRKVLDKNSASQIILTTHVPPSDRDRYGQDEIDQWAQLSLDYPIPYHISGHNHNPVISSFSNSQHITVGSTVKRYYWELIFDASGVTHKKIRF